jgi:hypothetical protein
MCLEISPLIIYPIIDRLLGGTSQDLFIPQRPMTLIETRLIGNVTSRGLIAHWPRRGPSVKKMQFAIAATESNPQLVQIVPPNEVVVVIGFELKMGNRAGTMNLCIPVQRHRTNHGRHLSPRRPDRQRPNSTPGSSRLGPPNHPGQQKRAQCREPCDCSANSPAFPPTHPARPRARNAPPSRLLFQTSPTFRCSSPDNRWAARQRPTS